MPQIESLLRTLEKESPIKSLQSSMPQRVCSTEIRSLFFRRQKTRAAKESIREIRGGKLRRWSFPGDMVFSFSGKQSNKFLIAKIDFGVHERTL